MSDSKIDEIKTALADNKCFTIIGNFELLFEMGFSMQDNDIDEDREEMCFCNIFDILYDNDHNEMVEFDYSFYKITGNEVLEIYLKKAYQPFDDRGKSFEYYLSLKGTYHLDDLSLIKSKKPALIVYNQYGQKSLSVTVRGPETEWFFHNVSNPIDFFGKFFYSDLYFGLARVDYDERKISDVYFKVGDKQITSTALGDVVPELKNCSYLKLLNWSKYVTQDHITLIEMNMI